jgi:hypothetical protein
MSCFLLLPPAVLRPDAAAGKSSTKEPIDLVGYEIRL